MEIYSIYCMLEVWEQWHFLAGNLWHIYLCFKPSLGTDSLPTHSEINIAIGSTARSQVSLHHGAALKVNIHVKKRSGYLFSVMFLQSQILSISFSFYWDLLLNQGSSSRAAKIFARPVIFFSSFFPFSCSCSSFQLESLLAAHAGLWHGLSRLHPVFNIIELFQRVKTLGVMWCLFFKNKY